MITAQHVVRDRAHRRLTFIGEVLATGTTAVPHKHPARWSEIVVYRLVDGTYIISEAHHSRVAHAPTCSRVNRRMVAWAAAPEDERQVPRTICYECRVEVQGIADDTLLETTIYNARGAATHGAMLDVLYGIRESSPRLYGLVQDVLVTL